LICFALLFSAPLFGSRMFAGETGFGSKRGVSTMTVNLYVGSGTDRVLALNPADPGYITNLIATVTGIYYEIAASQPQLRLQRVADEIAARKPDLVSVEEASLVRTESPGDLILGGTNLATHVVFDYLQILADALAARGAHYAVAIAEDELDVELPMLNLQTGTIDDARLTDRDAILVRTDLPAGHLKVSNPQHGHFRNVIQIATLGLSVERGWCSVDVFVRGQRFRYICTHLEEETAPQIQLLEAAELLNGPANVNLPVIIAGDLNADSLHRNGTTTYDSFIATGFTDAWTSLHPTDLAGGLTWGHDEFLADPDTLFTWRIDFVLFRGRHFHSVKADVLDLYLNLTQPPLWASDHAAVAADIEFK
jgi:endonuclease/exonuclease/phosphatase family metal-dependent hydrolase